MSTTTVLLVPAANGPNNPPASCRPLQQPDGTPTCIYSDGQWSQVDDSGGFGGLNDENSGGGIPGGFVFLFVIVLLAGVAFTIWKVSTARRMAADSGMNVRDATAMTLLSDEGFEATYLASNLRGTTPPAATPTPTQGPAAERLQELKRLLSSELITQAEYDERRKAIVDGL